MAVEPSNESPTAIVSRYVRMNRVFTDIIIFQHFHFGPNMEKWPDDFIMTSQDPLFAKLSNILLVIDIGILCKFEVIWIIQTEVVQKKVYVP